MQNLPIHKNQELELEIKRFGMDAAGVSHYGGRVLFIPGALPGERVLAAVTRIEKRHAFARVLRVLSPSAQRVEPPCPLYPRCGGCCALHMTYAESLTYKRQQVEDALRRVGGLDLPVPEVVGDETPWFYRNKAAYPVTGEAGAPQIGFFAARSHRVVDQRIPCRLQMPGSFEALQAVRGWMVEQGVAPYDEESHSGLIRHVVTRSTRDGEAMVVLVARQGELPAQEALLSALQAQVPGLASVYLSVNSERTNVILGQTARLLWGRPFLVERQHGLRLRMSPFSFFQVNPRQSEKLYDLALEFAGLGGSQTVIDAYSGAGGLSLLLAQKAGRVIGLEIVPEAVEDARDNAREAGAENAEFRLGAVESTLPALMAEGVSAQVLVLDPPRKGCAPEVIESVVQSRIPRVVYVSCNPATLARDAALLTQGGYRATAVQPVDMFCWTASVETVMCFEWEGKA